MSTVATGPTASELVAALRDHFGADLVGAEASVERDIAIHLCREWTNESARIIAETFRCDHATVLRADERVRDALELTVTWAASREAYDAIRSGSTDGLTDDQLIRLRLRSAEDHVASVAFPEEGIADDWCEVDDEVGEDR